MLHIGHGALVRHPGDGPLAILGRDRRRHIGDRVACALATRSRAALLGGLLHAFPVAIIVVRHGNWHRQSTHVWSLRSCSPPKHGGNSSFARASSTSAGVISCGTWAGLRRAILARPVAQGSAATSSVAGVACRPRRRPGMVGGVVMLVAVVGTGKAGGVGIMVAGATAGGGMGGGDATTATGATAVLGTNWSTGAAADVVATGVITTGGTGATGWGTNRAAGGGVAGVTAGGAACAASPRVMAVNSATPNGSDARSVSSGIWSSQRASAMGSPCSMARIS